MVGYRRFYHPLHSQIQTFPVARLTRALSRLSNRMELTAEQLGYIATWTSADDSFDAESAIRNVLAMIPESGAYTNGAFEDGGLSNYFAFLVCESSELKPNRYETYRQLKPLAVYLSLYAPVGVIGRTTSSYGTTFCGTAHLELDDLFEPKDARTNLERNVISTITCLLYTSPSPRDQRGSRMPSSA